MGGWKISYWGVAFALLGLYLAFLTYYQKVIPQDLGVGYLILLAIAIFLDYHFKRIDTLEDDVSGLKFKINPTIKHYQLENRINLLEDKFFKKNRKKR